MLIISFWVASNFSRVCCIRKTSSSRDWCNILHCCKLTLARLYLLDLSDEEKIRRHPRKHLRVSLLYMTVEACRRLSQTDESVRSDESVCKTIEQLLLTICKLCLKRSRMLSDKGASECPSLQQLCYCLARTLNFVRGVSVVTAVRDLFLHVDLRCDKVARSLSAAFFRSMRIAFKTAKATDVLNKQIVTRSLSLSVRKTINSFSLCCGFVHLLFDRHYADTTSLLKLFYIPMPLSQSRCSNRYCPAPWTRQSTIGSRCCTVSLLVSLMLLLRRH